jgi:transposase-like protein
MGTKSSRKYSSEFKHQALILADELGSMSSAASKLGISYQNIYHWRNQVKEQQKTLNLKVNNKSLSEKVTISSAEYEELKKLKQEVLDLRKTNIILKQAAAFFSQDHLK